MRRNILWLVVIAILCSFAGCAKKSDASDDTVIPPADPITVYRTAAENAANLKDMALIVSVRETITTGQEVYVQQIRQNLLYNDYGTDKMVARQTEARSYGDYQVSVESAFREGVCYFSVSDANYQVRMPVEDYCEMYVPAVLFNADLYENISTNSDGKTIIYSFSKATAVESWAAPENAALLDAYGSAVLDKDHRLVSSNYSVRYQHEGRTFTKSVSVSINPVKPQITFPDTSKYISLPLPQAPIFIEQAVGYLMQTKRATSITTEKIVCEVFGDTRTQSTVLNMYEDDKEYCALLDTNITLENPGRIDKVTTQQQRIRYADGVYATTLNGETTENSSITKEQMQLYCQDYLLSTILMSKYIDSIQISQNKKVYTITFTANEEMASMMQQHACEVLYGDASVLDELAESYKTDRMTGFITIDIKTLVPLSSGIKYTGTHQINGVSYPLIFETTQTYTIPSDTAYSTINP